MAAKFYYNGIFLRRREVANIDDAFLALEVGNNGNTI